MQFYDWHRVAIIAVRTVPLAMLVLLATPTWLFWIFLDQKRRENALSMVTRLVDWSKAVADTTSALPPGPHDDDTHEKL
jgi:hypothetical protein